METREVIAILGTVLAFTWLLPAIFFTVKICRENRLDLPMKGRLVFYLWAAPIIGVVICSLVFAKAGKLRKLSTSEHRGLWTAYRK